MAEICDAKSCIGPAIFLLLWLTLAMQALSLGTDGLECAAMTQCMTDCDNQVEHDDCSADAPGCSCSQFTCHTLNNHCLLTCGRNMNLTATCLNCLTQPNTDNCGDICPGVCVSSNCSNLRMCRQCVPGYYGPKCETPCSRECGGDCFDTTGYCKQCEAGNFGHTCQLQCPANCHHNICMSESGICYQCIAGYKGETCSQRCSKGTYGPSCQKICSQNCVDHECDYKSGKCLRGCKPGYFNIFCQRKCPNGTYGVDCLAQCPATCAGDGQCDHVTGSCIDGCISGFEGELCDQQCPTGRYSANCEKNCSNNCYMRVCSPFSGYCDRCIWDMDGPFCEKVRATPQTHGDFFDTDLSTDQIIIIFLTVFGVGLSMWFLTAVALYHRRKMMVQEIWKTGKLPSKVPYTWRMMMEHSSRSAIQRLAGYERLQGGRRYRRVPDAPSARRPLKYSERTNKVAEYLQSLETRDVDKVKDEEQLFHTAGSPDDVKPELPETQLHEEESSFMSGFSFSSDKSGVFTDYFPISSYSAPNLRPTALDLQPFGLDIRLSERAIRPIAPDFRQIALNTQPLDPDIPPISLVDRPTAEPELSRKQDEKAQVEDIGASSSTTITVDDSEYETTTESTETTEGDDSESGTTDSEDASITSTSTGKSTVKAAPVLKLKRSVKPNLKPQQTVPQKPPPILKPVYRPQKHTVEIQTGNPPGIFRKGLNLFSRLWSSGEVQKTKTLTPGSSKPPVTEKRYPSQSFLIYRLEQWKRTRAKAHDVGPGVFELNNEETSEVTTSNTKTKTSTETSTTETTTKTKEESETPRTTTTSTTGSSRTRSTSEMTSTDINETTGSDVKDDETKPPADKRKKKSSLVSSFSGSRSQSSTERFSQSSTLSSGDTSTAGSASHNASSDVTYPNRQHTGKRLAEHELTLGVNQLTRWSHVQNVNARDMMPVQQTYRPPLDRNPYVASSLAPKKLHAYTRNHTPLDNNNATHPHAPR